jgi:hypothetical protein
MRASLLSTAFVAALGVTTWTPSRADAQIIVNPSINTSPYAYANYWYPGYSYGYGYLNPYSGIFSSGSVRPWNNANYYWYNPYYTSYYRGRSGLWNGWRVRHWRW